MDNLQKTLPHKRWLVQEMHGLHVFEHLVHYESIPVTAVSISMRSEIGANIVIFQQAASGHRVKLQRTRVTRLHGTLMRGKPRLMIAIHSTRRG